MLIKNLLLVLLSSLLQIALFPKFNLSFAAWGFLIPLFFALEEKTPPWSFFFCLIFGSLSAVGNTYWLYPTVIGYFEQPILKGTIFTLFIQSGFAGLYFALFGFLYSALSFVENKTLKVLLVSSSWVVCEYMRSSLFTGLPWELAAHSQYKNLCLIQVCDITGVYGVSFVIVAVNYSLYLLLYRLIKEKALIHSRIKDLAFTLIPLCLLVFIVVYGKIRLSEFTETPIGGKNNITAKIDQTICVSIIQGNIKSRYRWRSAYYGRNLLKYLLLTKHAIKSSPAVIVWPENAINFYLKREPFLLSKIMHILKQAKVRLITGGPRYEVTEDGGNVYFNSAYYLTPSQKIAAIYDKIHLLPFSEYDFLSNINLYGEHRKVAPKKYSFGKRYTQFPLLNTQFSVVICYEIIYPHLVRQFVKRGAAFLINISNDSWFGKGAGPYQHLSLSIFRAVEHKCYLVRASTTGISAFITPTGRIKKRTGIFQEKILTDTILPRKVTTFYTRFGDVFAWLCIVATGIALIPAFLKRGLKVVSRAYH